MKIVSLIHKAGFFEYLIIKAIKLAKEYPKVALVYLVLHVASVSTILVM